MQLAPHIVPDESLTAAEDAAIRAALCRCFPGRP